MKLPKLITRWTEAKILPSASEPEKGSEHKKISKIETIFLPIAEVIILYGILLNFAFFALFDNVFNFYSWLAYGIAYYVITEEFPVFFRSLFPKRP